MNELSGLIGRSAAMVALRAQVERLLGRPRPGGRLPVLLIQGETGVGKGLLARAIHQTSGRRRGPWVQINCAAIPESLVEAELFGFERGAFTDARQAKPGLFQAAHGGVLFLDEVGTLPLGVQAKLLTALEQREVRRLGGTRSESVDVWILTATNQELPAAVAQGRFRADLYHRLSGLTLRLPPLRERGQDVVELAEHFLAQACADYGLATKQFTAEAQDAMLAYAWPGNVRELGNLIERVALLTDAVAITPAVLELPGPAARRRDTTRGVSPDSTAGERAALLAALEATQWNLSRAAAQVGIPRNTLRYRIERYGLRPAQGAAGGPPEPGTPVSAEHPASSATPGTALRWERRWVTALRVALVLPAGLATFQLAPILEDLVFKVRSFGARLEELYPQGLLALFGLDPMEDAPIRAVHAAWAIQRSVERLHPDSGVTCAIHVSECLIGRGGAVAGMEPTDKRQLMAPVEALTAQATPPSIVVSDASARFLERRFELVPVGPPAMAGYRIIGRGRSGFEVGGLTRSPFVGRDRELAFLDDLLVQAEQGQGQAVGLLGEPGVGKSRLLYEFSQSLGRGRITYLEGRCVSYGHTIPYLPILDVVRQNFALAETDAPELASEKIAGGLRTLGLDPQALAPYLLHLLGFKEGAEGPLAPLSPELIKTRTIEALRQLSLAGSQKRPVVIAIEDLHWIDQTSADTLVVLVESLAACRVLLLATYRPGCQPPWLGKSYASQLVLRRLSRRDSVTIVQALPAGGTLSTDLTDTIVTHADGVPFFLEELTRAVAEHADLRTPLSVPDTLQGVLTARLDRLSPPEKQVLEAAAVLGKDVALPFLRALVTLPDPEFHQALAHLQAAEFLLETGITPTRTLTFKHALTQEVASRSILADRRTALHAEAARAIERLAPELVDRTPEVLAHHYTEAGLSAQAITYWHRAGQHAVQRSANTEAVSHLRQGLALLPTLPDDHERARIELLLLLTLGNPLMVLKGYGASDVDAIFARARALCEHGEDSPQRFSALFALWRFHTIRAELLAAHELGGACFALAQRLDDPRLLVQAHFAVGASAFHLGHFASALTDLEQGIALYHRDRHSPLQGTDSGVASRCYAARVLWFLGYPDQALGRIQEALALARGSAHTLTLGYAIHHATALHTYRGDMQVVHDLAEEAIALAQDQGFVRWSGSGLMRRGWVLAKQGSPEEGIAQIRAGLATWQGYLGLSHFLALLAEAHGAGGQPEAGLGVVDEALAVADKNAERHYEAELYRLKGELLLQQAAARPRPHVQSPQPASAAASTAEQEEAARCFQKAIDIARRQQAKSVELRAVMSLTRLWQDQRRAEARQMLGEIYGWFREGFTVADLREAKALLEELA